jgi:ferrous iron transport protein B
VKGRKSTAETDEAEGRHGKGWRREAGRGPRGGRGGGRGGRRRLGHGRAHGIAKHWHRDAERAGRSRFVLVGNPNVGKSVIFSLLTGKYVTVSNYPGTTVEISRGEAGFLRNGPCEVIDTPGANNLLPMSEDEIVARDMLLEPSVKGVVQVIDAKNLRRGLLLSLQLSEMGLPFVVALNMSDEAASRGIRIDERALAGALGVEVVPTVATQRKGIRRLTGLIPSGRRSRARVRYRPEIESALVELEPLIPSNGTSSRAITLMLLAGDESMAGWVRSHLPRATVDRIEEVRRRLRGTFGGSVGYAITEDRLKAADKLLAEVQRRSDERPVGAVRDFFETATTHPVFGQFFMALTLVAVFAFVGYFGAQVLVDLLETRLFGGVVNPAAIRLFDFLLPFPHAHVVGEAGVEAAYTVTAQSLTAAQQAARFVHDLLVGPYGAITMALTYSVAIVLPIVGTFFLAFGFLEDSGYQPRVAVMVNRAFKTLGLNGKAVLPMILGLGCDTMATLTARILETRKERVIVTLLLALGVPCSAQLGVIIGMLASISVLAGLIWAGVVVGVMFAVGFLAARLLPGKGSDFILELPPLRLPRADNIAFKTLARMEWYLKEAVPLFVLGTLVLFVMDKLALMSSLEKVVSPVVQGLLNLPAAATQAFLVGFLRRDYGAAGLYSLSKSGQMDAVQTLVSLVVITLFVPCVANFFVIIKERGFKTAMAVVGFIFPFAFLVGGLLNLVLRALDVRL